jgi:hypothetical protein
MQLSNLQSEGKSMPSSEIETNDDDTPFKRAATKIAERFALTTPTARTIARLAGFESEART